MLVWSETVTFDGHFLVSARSITRWSSGPNYLAKHVLLRQTKVRKQSIESVLLYQRADNFPGTLVPIPCFGPSLVTETLSVMPMANIGGVGDAIGPEAWFRSLPIITQYWFGAVAAVTLATNFGLFDVKQLVFLWPAIKDHFELWRFATCFLFMGPFSMNTLLAMYMLVSFSQKYEAGGPFNTGAGGGTADYVFCLLFAMVSMLLTYPLLGPLLGLPPLFAGNLVYFVLYLWSKRNPTAQANIWGVPMPGSVLPFAYLGLTVVMGHNYMDLIHGFLFAHVYYFLADVVPQVQGRDIINTPQFLIDYFGVGEYRPEQPDVVRPPPGGAAPPPGGAGAGAGFGGYQWGGAGRPLGRE